MRPPVERGSGAPAAAVGEEEGAVHRVTRDPHVPVVIEELGRRGEDTRLEHLRLAPSRPWAHGRNAQLVDGERAGLVGRDHGRGADRLDRGKPANDRTARRHRPRALGERDRHRRGQPFRDRGHGDGDADEEGLLE